MLGTVALNFPHLLFITYHNFFCNGFLIHNCDYRGEIGVILINLGQEDKTIMVGDKIAQLIFETYTRVDFEESETLEDTERGAGGFGSTGT